MRRSIVVVGVSLPMALLLTASPARADDPCVPLLGGCDASVEVTPADVLDDPVGAVDDTLDDVSETVDPVVGPVLDLIDGILPGEDDPPPGGGPGPDPDGRGTVVEGRGGGGGGDGSSGGFPDAFGREGTRPALTLIGTAASETRPLAPRGAPGGPGVIGAALRGLLILAALLGLAVAFAALQSRFDRKDPKLAVAPARAEEVAFG